MNQVLTYFDTNIFSHTEYAYFSIIYSAVILVILLSYIAVKYISFSKKQKELKIIQQASYSRAIQIIQDARNKSYEILTQANDMARKIVSDTKVFSESSGKELSKEVDSLAQQHVSELNRISQDLLASYKSLVEKEKKDSFDTIETLSQGIKDQILTEIDQFKEDIHKETIETESEVRLKVEKQYEDMEKSLQEYKAERLRKIDNAIYKIVVQVSKDVIGKGMTLEDHENLIINSLEDAKKRSEFTS